MTAILTAAPDLLLEADAISGLADGAAVVTWNDGSGNGRNASGGVSPTYKTGAAPSGLPAVRFNGTSQYLTSAASTSASAQTVVAVVRHQGTGDRAFRGVSANGGMTYRYNSDGTLGVDKGGMVNVGNSPTKPPAGWHIVTMRFGPGLWDIRVDGTPVVSGSPGTTPDAGKTTVIGAYTPAGQFFNGDIALVASWSRSLTDAELNAIEAEQATKWGTAKPKGTVTASSQAGTSWQPVIIVDGNVGDNGFAWAAQFVPPGWTKVQFPEARIVASYTITARTGDPAAAPRDWTFEGSNDNSSWTTLDTRSGQGFTASQARTYTISNTTAYTYYRLNITANTSGGPNVPSFSEWEFTYAAPAAPNPLDGSVDVVSAADGSLSAALSVSGQVDAVAAVDGSVTATLGLSGQVDAVSDAQGVFLSGVEYAIDGQVDATSGAEGTLSSVFPVDGQVDGVSTVEGDLSVSASLSGQVDAVSTVRGFFVGSALGGAAVSVGVTVEVGALTLLNLVTLPGTEVPVGLGSIRAGDSLPVVPLPGVNVAVGLSLDARPVDLVAADPRHKRTQWRYVVTDLANKPLGELVDIQHDPVADGVNTPTTMRFTMASDDPTRTLVEAGGSLTRKCQVWAGNQLLLWGPILPDQQSDNGTASYTVHDPSWWWRGGRRVIGRLPRKNLLRNGDFKQNLTYWTRGYDADSKPKAAPKVRVVSEDFLEDTDGLDPIRAAEITGVESFTESELSSNAVFWPNLATFRPGGKAAIEAVANAMPSTAGLKVTVIGHTANDGTGNGLGLSKRRADAAAAIIHAKRPGAVITTKGVGFYDPKPGFPIGSQEQRRVVIQYDQTISGESKQWIKQTIEVTQPKSARYPLDLTLAAMLKVADDWSVPDANMVSLKVVVRRKGAAKPLAWDEQLGQGESSISDTDPVDRWIGQSASATVPADGRAYLVDAYLYAPAALARYTAVGLFPEEELYFWGVDQALIFKGIAEHIQDTSMGHGDLGIETRTPLTGIKRDRTYPFRDHMPADTALEEFAGLNRGMDYDTLMLADGRVILSTFYPQQGKHTPYVLVQGGNVANASPERSRDVASSIIMQAQDLGSYRAEAYAKDTRALGGLLLERVVTAEQETPLNELREAARQELAWGRVSTTGYWLDIDPELIDDVLASTGKGDVVRLILDSPDRVDALARIVSRERHPDSLRLLVTLDQEA